MHIHFHQISLFNSWSLSHCMYLTACQKPVGHSFACLFLSPLCVILIYIPVFMTIQCWLCHYSSRVYSEHRSLLYLQFCSFPLGLLWLLAVFVFPNEYLFGVKNYIILKGIALNLHITFGKRCIFIKVILPMQEHLSPSYSTVSYLISPIGVFKVHFLG